MKLIFVYNGEHNPVALLIGTIHKLVSPSTHVCALCSITYGTFRMDPRWKDWWRRLPFPVEFLHRKEFRRGYPDQRVALPAIFVENEERLELLVSALDMQSLETVDDLVALINRRLKLRRPLPVPAAP